MDKGRKLNAVVEDEIARRLQHALIDDRLTYKAWLGRAIEYYLAEKGRGVTDPFRAGETGKGREGEGPGRKGRTRT